ncbi:uncharacterized protein Dana_GF21327 [Drosophila ananassae]|uniref:Proteasomal ubiquitin receptor ADRM1 homolog n=1 Tax=Drosophila ananassae TaxID=7217 RepID=B3MRP7_DROAN|nr:uncharacterized protein Dana_GF21327 [Drosophila ananassae]
MMMTILWVWMNSRNCKIVKPGQIPPVASGPVAQPPVLTLTSKQCSLRKVNRESSTLDPSENLIEYKAGRMVLQGKMVQPDDRKGLLFVRRSAGNQVHIHWMDRHSGDIELDVVASAGSLEFRRVEECKTGRVYVLKFRGSVRRYFFWMQEPHPENDAEFCKKLNELISSSNRRRFESAAAEGDVDTEPETRTDAEDLPSVGSRGGGGCEEKRSALQIEERGGGGSDNATDVLLMENPFANAPESELDWPASFGRESSESTVYDDEYDVELPQLDLAMALRMEWSSAIDVLLNSAPRRQNLMAHLPVDLEDDPDDPEWPSDESRIIKENLHCPQFYEALETFTYGLQAGAMRPILEVMIPNNEELLAAAQAGDIETFIRVLHHQGVAD